MYSEKRISPRAKIALDVEVENQTRRWTGRSVDLSMAGLSMDLDDPPALGHEVKLHFSLPDGSRVEALAVPIWMASEEPVHRIGLRFERLLDGYVELGDFLVQFRSPD